MHTAPRCSQRSEGPATGSSIRLRVIPGRPLHGRAVVRLALGAVLGLLGLSGSGCTPLTPYTPGDSSARDPGSGVAPSATLSAITAPSPGRGADELARLERFHDHPGALLRSAWLLQENHENVRSLRPINLVLFGVDAPDDEVEALARWLRARAEAARGNRDAASHDLAQARRLTRDAGLVARLDGLDLPGSAPDPVVDSRRLVTLPRAAWDAKPARSDQMERMGRIDRITVHHSATIARPGSEQAAATAVRGIQKHHQEHNGWADIGYHFLIDPAGRIFQGRELTWQGAHAGDPSRNRHNVGVCLLGNYVATEQGRPPAGQLRALDGLLSALCARFGVPSERVLTHRELKSTTCPGPYLQAAVEAYRDRGDRGAVAAGSR